MNTRPQRAIPFVNSNSSKEAKTNGQVSALAPATAHQFFEDALGILDCVSDGEQ